MRQKHPCSDTCNIVQEEQTNVNNYLIIFREYSRVKIAQAY